MAVNDKAKMLCGHEKTECSEDGSCLLCVKTNARRPVEEELRHALQLLREWNNLAANVTWSPMLDLYKRTRDILNQEAK